MNDVFAARKCVIKIDEGIEQVLLIQFFLPQCMNDKDEFEATAVIECNFFKKSLKSIGEDSVQALFLLRGPVLSYLKNKVVSGYSIFWMEPGDLDYSDFWGYRP